MARRKNPQATPPPDFWSGIVRKNYPNLSPDVLLWLLSYVERFDLNVSVALDHDDDRQWRPALQDVKHKTRKALEALFVAARRYGLDLERMKYVARHDIQDRPDIPHFVLSANRRWREIERACAGDSKKPVFSRWLRRKKQIKLTVLGRRFEEFLREGYRRPEPKRPADYRRGRRQFELLREQLQAELEKEQRQARKAGASVEKKQAEPIGDYWPADSLLQQYGCLPSCLSRKKNDRLIRWKPAPAGQKSEGRPVRVLYHRDDAKRLCKPKKARDSDSAKTPIQPKTYRVSR